MYEFFSYDNNNTGNNNDYNIFYINQNNQS